MKGSMESLRLIFIQPSCRELVLNEFPALTEYVREDIESLYTLIVIHESMEKTFVDRDGRLWLKTENIPFALTALTNYFKSITEGTPLKEAHEYLLKLLTGESCYGKKEKDCKEKDHQEKSH